MRIAFFVDSFPVLSETFILNQITGLIDRGHDVHIYARGRRAVNTAHSIVEEYDLLHRTYYLTTPGKGWLQRLLRFLTLITLDSVRHIPANLKGAFLAARYRRILQSIPYLGLLQFTMNQTRNGPYDVVHCQYGTLGRLFIRLKVAGLMQCKFITSFRGHDITKDINSVPGFYDELFEYGDVFLPVSRDLKNKLTALGCQESKISVLHSGIDCSKFQYAERHLTKGSPIVLLTIARLVEMKGVSYGIRAATNLINSGENIRYIIVGDGPLREELSHLISDLGVEKDVELLGWMNHTSILKLLKQAHILVAPSVTASNGEAEGIPNAVKEAMAMGIPIVSTLHSGIPELVDDEVSGFLVPERDINRLTDRLAYLIDHPERWPSMGVAGRAKVERDFDINKLNDQLLRLYSAQYPPILSA
jgi:colanic acid/amylovoran biosynthesis glycosyltransferase